MNREWIHEDGEQDGCYTIVLCGTVEFCRVRTENLDENTGKQI